MAPERTSCDSFQFIGFNLLIGPNQMCNYEGGGPSLSKQILKKEKENEETDRVLKKHNFVQ